LHPFLSTESPEGEILLGEVAGGNLHAVGRIGCDESPEKEQGQKSQNQSQPKVGSFSVLNKKFCHKINGVTCWEKAIDNNSILL
jgi:hypothetical protein